MASVFSAYQLSAPHSKNAADEQELPLSDISTETTSNFLSALSPLRSNRKINHTAFQSTPKQNQTSDQVFKQDLNMQYSRNKALFLGNWATEAYQVTRKYIMSSDINQVKLYCTFMEPYSKEVKGQIVVVHGLGEHQNKYINVGDYFAQNEYRVLLYDQRGHGYSGGLRGQSSIKEMHQDLESVLMQLDQRLPIFIYCHSVGCAIVFSFCIVNPHLNLQGVISTNAYLRAPEKCSLIKKKLLGVLNRLLPDLKINNYMDFSHLSKNNYNLKKVIDDRIQQQFITVQMAYNIIQLCEFIFPNCHKFQYPILLIHGKQDRIASHLNSLNYYRLIGSKNKTVKIYEYGFHEIHNDSEQHRMKKLVVSWCNKVVEKEKKVSLLQDIRHGIREPKRVSGTRVFSLILVALILKRQGNGDTKIKCRKFGCVRMLSLHSLRLLSQQLVKLLI